MGKIRCPINEAAHMSQNQPGIISDQGGLLYTEVEQLVVATHELLVRRGVQPGDFVAVMIRNGWEQVILFWALLRLGAVMCPMPAAAPREALENILRELGVRFAVSDRPEREFDGVTTLELKDLVGFTAKFKQDYRPMLALDSAAVIQYAVSGTGQVRYVQHSVGSCYYAALGGNATLPLRSSDNRWLMKPLYTYQGTDVLFRCAIAGASVATKEHLDANVEELNRYEITHVTMESDDEVDTLIAHLRDGESELKQALFCGRLSPARRKALREADSVQAVAYLGTPETGYYAVETVDGVIQPLRYHVVRLGKDGTLQVRGRGLCSGYFAAGEVTPCTDEEGWFDTGLPAAQDGSGQLFFP